MSSVTASNKNCWPAETVDEPRTWYHRLAGNLLDALRDVIASYPAEAPVTQIWFDSADRAKWAKAVQPALQDLEDGRGFVIIDGLPIENLTDREATAIYW